jgi:hypothetical protein
LRPRSASAPNFSRTVIRSAIAWHGCHQSHCMLNTGTDAASATSRMYLLPVFQKQFRIAIPCQ